MADSTKEFFEELGRRGHEPLLEKVVGTVRFDLVQDEKTERWFVTIARGDVAVSRRNTKADTVLRLERALFDSLVTGRANALAAVLRGSVTVEGDPEAVVLFQRLFPGPSGSRDPRPAAGRAGTRR